MKASSAGSGACVLRTGPSELGAFAPAHTPFKLRVFRADGDGLTLGIDDQIIDGVPVKITNIARTIVDCFKRRDQVGLDVAIEALRNAPRAAYRSQI